VGASGNRDCALCRRHGMDPPRNQGHSRFGYERPGQVGGYWNSGGRGGFGVFCLGRSTSPKRHDRVKLKAGNPQSQFREADHQPIPISLPAMPRRPDSDVSTGPWVLRFPVGVVGRHRRGRSVCSLAALEEFSSRRRVLGERPRTSCPRGWLECQSGTDGRDDAATHAPGRSDGTPPPAVSRSRSDPVRTFQSQLSSNPAISFNLGISQTRAAWSIRSQRPIA